MLEFSIEVDIIACQVPTDRFTLVFGWYWISLELQEVIDQCAISCPVHIVNGVKTPTGNFKVYIHVLEKTMNVVTENNITNIVMCRKIF